MHTRNAYRIEARRIVAQLRARRAALFTHGKGLWDTSQSLVLVGWMRRGQAEADTEQQLGSGGGVGGGRKRQSQPKRREAQQPRERRLCRRGTLSLSLSLSLCCFVLVVRRRLCSSVFFCCCVVVDIYFVAVTPSSCSLRTSFQGMQRLVALVTLSAMLVAAAAAAGGGAGLYGSNSNVQVLNKSNFAREVLASRGVWLVEFYAPWCT